MSGASVSPLREMVEELVRDHAAGLIAEPKGRLSAAEVRFVLEAEARAPSDSEPSQLDIDVAIGALLEQSPMTPEEYLSVWSRDHGGPPDGERENAYLALRLHLANAFVKPSITNFVAVGEAAQRCARLAMREAALDHIREAA